MDINEIIPETQNNHQKQNICHSRTTNFHTPHILITWSHRGFNVSHPYLYIHTYMYICRDFYFFICTCQNFIVILQRFLYYRIVAL